MHRTPLPKALIPLILWLVTASLTVFGQAKSEAELTVTRCWSYEIEGGRSIAADGIRAFVATSDAKVEAMSLDGKKLWATELGGEIASNILPTGNGVFLAVASTASGDKQPSASLRVLSKETGIPSLSLKLPNVTRHSLFGWQNSVLIVSANGVIQSIDNKTGVVRWKREVAEAFAGEAVVSGERVFVTTPAKQIFAISIAGGDIELMRKLPFAVTAIVQSTAGELIVGDERGNVTSTTKDLERLLWRFRSGGLISSIRAINGNLLVSSHDNFVYYLTTRNGGLVWKKRFAGRVSSVGLVLNEAALLSSSDEHGATFVSLATGKPLGQIALDDDESFATDPIFINGLMLAITTRRLSAYSLSGCTLQKVGGTSK